jgi:branched-subunit amino acid aminotransferase/4-amino-4-deoxychorismate lyase
MSQNDSIFFETMLMRGEKIRLWPYHYKRIEKTWRYFFPFTTIPSSDYLLSEINKQISIKSFEKKIRLNFGYNHLEIISQEFESEIHKSSIIKKLIIYYDEKINADKNNFKTTERIIYDNSMKFAWDNHADQAIILDKNNHIVETSIANILFIKDQEIHTPLLQNGCVEGVYRSYLKERILKSSRLKWIEKNISLDKIKYYDKILTINALKGINYAKII